MNVSRTQLGVALAVVGLAVVACMYSFRRDGGGAASAASPARPVLERMDAPKSASAIAADAGPSARVAIEPAASLPATTPSPVEESKPTDTRAAEKSQWEKEFAGLKQAALEKAMKKIGHELTEATRETFNTWFDGGRYEVVGHGNSYSFDEETWDHTKVNAVRMNSPGTDEIRMVVLPESQYPEFYAVKRKMLWLENQAQRPERQD